MIYFVCLGNCNLYDIIFILSNSSTRVSVSLFFIKVFDYKHQDLIEKGFLSFKILMVRYKLIELAKKKFHPYEPPEIIAVFLPNGAS